MTKNPTARKPTATKRAAPRTAAKKATTRPTAVRKTPTKAATRPAPKSAAKTAEQPKVEKQKKAKLVRDSFTMPESEYALLAQLKKACLGAGFEIKKSELLRIGVAQLAALDAKKLKAAQAALTPVKTGRPKKHK